MKLIDLFRAWLRDRAQLRAMLEQERREHLERRAQLRVVREGYHL